MRGAGRDDDAGPAASFVRGLTIGALLGAAVAGSSLWSRRRRARRAAADGDAIRIDPGTATTAPSPISAHDAAPAPASPSDAAPSAAGPSDAAPSDAVPLRGR